MNRQIFIEYSSECKADGAVRLPLSKSVAARALILSHIYFGRILLGELPDCDDTYELGNALRQMVENEGEFDRYDLGNGGTSLRFFLAFAASCSGFEGEIDCSDALRRRPLAPLIDALRSAGADIECIKEEGYTPVKVRGRRLSSLKERVDGSMSSQFLSALMMASEMWRHPFVPDLEGVVSTPYVEMTRKMIVQFRTMAESDRGTEIYNIEGDWSSASYFYELAVLVPGKEITLYPLTIPEDSLQGDSFCARLFARLGVKTEFCEGAGTRICCDGDVLERLRKEGGGFEADLNATPDLVPALAVGLCMADVRFELTGIGHLRHKESDRLAAICCELAKAGYVLKTGPDSLSWDGEKKPLSGCNGIITFDAHSDHRMAMALSMSAVKLGRIGMAGAECVSKSFPGFFDQLERVGFCAERAPKVIALTLPFED